MRNISFSLTTHQYRAGTKTVTRRLNWLNSRRGDRYMGCVKCQGLRPGVELQRIHPCRIVDASREPLSRMIDDPQYGLREARLEGFPHLDGRGFVEMFCKEMKAKPDTLVTRLQFEHVFPQQWVAEALASATLNFDNEIKLHDEIAIAFQRAGIPFRREVKIHEGRLDFLVLGHVAVEVKTHGDGVAANRQAFRYLENESITQAIVISARPMQLPASGYQAADGSAKGLHLIELWRNGI